jgi:hypothetical protein
MRVTSYVIRLTTEGENTFPRINYEMLKSIFTCENFFDSLAEFKQPDSNAILVTVNTELVAEHLLLRQKSILNIPVKAKLILTNICRSYVMTGFYPGIAASSIANELMKIGITPIAVKLWTRKVKFEVQDEELKGRDLISKADVVVMGQAPVNGLIHVAKQVVKLIPKRIPLLQCNTCFRYGHKACHRKQKCSACAKPGHEAGHQECTKISSCVNCGKSHTAQARECSYRHREIQIINLMQEQGISRSTALQKTFGKNKSVPTQKDFPEMNNGGTQVMNQKVQHKDNIVYDKVTYAQKVGTSKQHGTDNSAKEESLLTERETVKAMGNQMQEQMKKFFKEILECNYKVMQDAIRTITKTIYQQLPELVLKCVRNLEKDSQQQRYSQKKFKATSSPDKEDDVIMSELASCSQKMMDANIIDGSRLNLTQLINQSSFGGQFEEVDWGAQDHDE